MIKSLHLTFLYYDFKLVVTHDYKLILIVLSQYVKASTNIA